jgi:AraC-like DNA-binding protein
MDSTSTTFLFNDRFENLLNLKSDSPEFNYELLSIVNRLYVNYQANPTLDILIYLPREQYLINSKTANKLSFLYDTLNSKGNSINLGDWNSQLGGLYRDAIFISPYMSYRNFGEDSVVFARSVPLTANSKILANIFVSVPYSHIRSVSDISSGTFMILNDQGQVLEPADSSISYTLKPSGNKGTETIQIDGKPFILSYVKSDNTSWYYAVLVPKNDFWRKANYIRIITFASTIISLLLGSISILWLLKHNYRPVRNVVNLISNKENMNSKNEFTMIIDAYTRLNKENTTMRNNITKQLERSREMFLLSKLKAVNSHLVDEDSMEYFQLDFENKHFSLVSFYRSYTEEDIKFFDNDYMAYNSFIRFVLNNIFSELTNNQFQYYPLSDGELIHYLFVLDKNEVPLWEQECIESLKELHQFLLQKLDLSFYITVGEICDSFHNINTFYEDVIEAHEYNCMIHETGIVLVKDVAEPNRHNDKIMSKYEKRLLDALMLSNFRKASIITDSIFDEFMTDVTSTFYLQKFHIYHMIDIILNSAQQDVIISISGKHFQALLDNITLCTNVQALKKAFLSILKSICGISQEKYDERMQSLTNCIKNFVNENYMDCNLSIASIAHSMNLNPKYMSRLFKEENEEGLLDYINIIRIQKAKSILASQDIMLEDLALMVGYTNVRTFRRAFLKMEGTTPSQYKKMEA